MMIIRSIELQTSSLKQMSDFYSGALGMQTVVDSGGARLLVKVGESDLVFLEEPEFTGCWHFAFNIPCNRLRDAIAFLESKNVQLLKDEYGEIEFEFSSWNARAVYFRDPGGNVVELIARNELHNESIDDRTSFCAKEFLCISEIGVSVDDPSGTASRLSEGFGFQPYKDSSSEFIPLGDPNGLLIIVRTGRTWFPTTNAHAMRAPLRIRLQDPVNGVITLTEEL